MSETGYVSGGKLHVWISVPVLPVQRKTAAVPHFAGTRRQQTHSKGTELWNSPAVAFSLLAVAQLEKEK